MKFCTVKRLTSLSGVPWDLGTFPWIPKFAYSRWNFEILNEIEFEFWKKVGSYAYDETKMTFNASLLTYNDTLRNTILDYNVELEPLKSKDSVFVWQSIGNYSLTGYEMTLKRNSLKYIVNYYLPSGLFVIVSWVSFLIPPEIVPGRMTLLVTIFLVLINIFNNVTSNSPNVEGLTAISSK